MQSWNITSYSKKDLKVFSSFLLISDDFRLKVPKIAKTVPKFLADVHKDG